MTQPTDDPTAGDPEARPRSYGLAIVVVTLLVAAVLVAWIFSSSPEERAPNPTGDSEATGEGPPIVPQDDVP